MREQHPVFDNAVDREATIWRYFGFPKFVATLRDSALYFSRADLLGDPLEGSFTRAREEDRRRLLDSPPDGLSREELEQIFAQNRMLPAVMPKCTFVNCWHLGEQESMAMWRGYGDGPFGVAFRTTFGRLDDCLPDSLSIAEPANVFLGKVIYLDHSSQQVAVPNEFNIYAPFVCKSVAYKHEQEIRAVFCNLYMERRSELPIGHNVPVDLNLLVQEVVISPLAPEWFDAVVQSVCEKFGFTFPTLRSRTGSAPIY